MKVLALIPARGGSKGIPRKNIAPLAGHPLIAWTILAARKAKELTRIIVSTDDEKIAEIARHYGAEIPFLRPAEIAQDNTSGIAPLLHAVRWLQENERYRPDWVIYLQPTSPLRTSEDIEGTLRLAEKKKADAVLSVTAVDHHPYIMKELDPEGRIRHFLLPKEQVAGRQDHPPLFALNGAIWLIRTEILLEKEDWYTDMTYAYVMPPERSLDIDSPWDLKLAELILREKLNDHPDHPAPGH